MNTIVFLASIAGAFTLGYLVWGAVVELFKFINKVDEHEHE